MKNKRFAAIGAGAMTLALTMCSSAALGVQQQYRPVINTPFQVKSLYEVAPKNLMDVMVARSHEMTMLEQQARMAKEKQIRQKLRSIELKQNLINLRLAIENTEKYVGKTWYVFSGSTPKGWDCSGLVTWTFANMGFDLYHSATAQMKDYGYQVENPKYGDIVGFRHSGSSRYYHVGIYLSDGMMLHSGGKRGDKTEVVNIDEWAKGNGGSVVHYNRIIETK